MGHELLQSGTGNLLPRGAVATPRWGKYYKMGQILQRRAVHRLKIHQVVDQKTLYPSLIPLICLICTRTNEGTCLQIVLMRYESTVVQYVATSFQWRGG